MKSPLFLSTNVRNTFGLQIVGFDTILLVQLSALDQGLLEIVKNDEIIAINQDPVVGTSISPFRWGVNVSLGYVQAP